jgi:hypothetical protein
VQTWLLTKASARAPGRMESVYFCRARACLARMSAGSLRYTWVVPPGRVGPYHFKSSTQVSDPASPQMNVLLIITGAFCGSIFLFGTYAHESVLKAVPVEVGVAAACTAVCPRGAFAICVRRHMRFWRGSVPLAAGSCVAQTHVQSFRRANVARALFLNRVPLTSTLFNFDSPFTLTYVRTMRVLASDGRCSRPPPGRPRAR